MEGGGLEKVIDYLHEDKGKTDSFAKDKYANDMGKIRHAFLMLSSILNSKDPKCSITLY